MYHEVLEDLEEHDVHHDDPHDELCNGQIDLAQAAEQQQERSCTCSHAHGLVTAATVWVQIKGIEIHEKSGYLTSSLSTGSGSELHYPLQALDATTAVALGVGQKLGEYFQFYYQQGQPRLNYSGLVFRLDSELLVKLD